MIKRVIKKITRVVIKKQPPLLKTTNVGILYLCTGRYEMFFDSFYKSFEHKFLSGAIKNYYVFTDSERIKNKYKKKGNIRFFSIEHKGWPLGTLLRNRYFYENFEAFNGNDYLFFCNANLVCKDKVYLNELGLTNGHNMCGVQHPFFFQKDKNDFIVEKTTQCNAFFSEDEIARLQYYFQGCFYGGKYQAFKEQVNTIYAWTEEDLKKDIMPIWLDESYLNRYFFLNPPYPLHSGFAYPGNATIPLPLKILGLDKQRIGGAYFKR